MIGSCEEQRHTFWIQAATAKAAERIAIQDHDGETSFTLTIAGVAQGRVTMVDQGP